MAIDDTLLSRMLSVAELVPDVVLEASVRQKASAAIAGKNSRRSCRRRRTPRRQSFIAGEKFAEAQSDDRFNTLLSITGAAKTPDERKKRKALDLVAARSDRQGHGKGRGKSYTLALSAKDGPQLGAWILNNLKSIYRDFREAKKTGD